MLLFVYKNAVILRGGKKQEGGSQNDRCPDFVTHFLFGYIFIVRRFFLHLIVTQIIIRGKTERVFFVKSTKMKARAAKRRACFGKNVF